MISINEFCAIVDPVINRYKEYGIKKYILEYDVNSNELKELNYYASTICKILSEYMNLKWKNKQDRRNVLYHFLYHLRFYGFYSTKMFVKNIEVKNAGQLYTLLLKYFVKNK